MSIKNDIASVINDQIERFIIDDYKLTPGDVMQHLKGYNSKLDLDENIIFSAVFNLPREHLNIKYAICKTRTGTGRPVSGRDYDIIKCAVVKDTDSPKYSEGEVVLLEVLPYSYACNLFLNGSIIDRGYEDSDSVIDVISILDTETDAALYANLRK